MAGKDRTGLVVALLLRLAGVSPEDVAADYTASEAAWAPRHGEWVVQARDEVERRRRSLLGPTPRDALVKTFAELEHRHGDLGRYVEAAGLDEHDLARIRVRLVT